MSDEVLVEQRDSTLLIALNRPRARNAIDTAVSDGLLAAVERLNRDASLRVGVLTGTGTAFCSGMDLNAFAKTGMPDGIGHFLRDGSAEKPLIAAIEGYALGGGLELALACDLIVAATGAKLGLPEAKVGLFAAGGGLLRLPQRIPENVALEMAITGEPLSAERGYELGLISRLTQQGAAADEALALAELIGRCAPLSVGASRRLVRRRSGIGDDDFYTYQKPLLKAVFRSQDAKEGPRAFAEKRQPQWSGT
ncbi:MULTISPECIES: crotonase/enoyl-CoA hydratase family protein [unclassified Mycobacterium]|uniref:crotonase/enoyl-CoA hydratase family protein n=1 Tax=unclassified Mycobacterium TaxID=2642494 RepID=UPI0007404259|nr:MULTISPECIES: crotonase/enoyl-CoA hydratase family protein [unclassified Mycobacterium]KUH83125.1 enoyl-CoA hydratase [Mycobacterium sp. GA-0227b]KUH84465.1 enoyl-CoA hydratase [Mycobacterium sp. GA-1999]KUH89399.1 enoyl-CoA hydratase [Mycobacterium sp. IS-1556]